MNLLVNGEEKRVRDGIMLTELVRELSLERHPIAVELNLRVVPRESYASTPLSDGDRLEIVSLVGGG